jgi:predicted nuclease with TOPRIM domain
MFDTITIVLVLLTLSAVAAAGFAVLYLSKVKRNLSELGMRVLESQDIGKIKEAASKAGSFESRLAGWEQNAQQSDNQLAENKTKLHELADNLDASEEKMASLEVRLNELTTRLESVEQKTSKNENDLAQTVPNIKALADEIQSLKIFQSATEKIHSLIQSAFTDMQAGVPSNEGFVTPPEFPTPEEANSEASTPEEITSEAPAPEDSTPEDAVKELEDWQNEKEPPRVTGSRRWLS